MKNKTINYYVKHMGFEYFGGRRVYNTYNNIDFYAYINDEKLDEIKNTHPEDLINIELNWQLF